MRTITNSRAPVWSGDGAAPARVPQRPKTFAERMGEIVVGQEAAIRSVARAITLQKAGLAPQDKPIGVYLFLGPTGVGKTLFVEALAAVLHDDNRKVLRINMNEFERPHEIARLIGAPPGYLGHRETAPLLTQAKLNQVTSDASNIRILLLDEIEKAAPELFNHFLSAFDTGRMRMGDNTETSFVHTIFILTSNLGTGELTNLAKAAGFGRFAGGQEVTKTAARATIDRALKARFKPEFLNRITDTIVFESLTREQVEEIVRRELRKLQMFVSDNLGLRAPTLVIASDVHGHLTDLGMSPAWGAREVVRLISKEITVRVAERVIEGNAGAELRVSLADGQILVTEA